MYPKPSSNSYNQKTFTNNLPMNRRIKKVAVLGSGIMGAGIACHFANIGVEVLLLDIVPKEPNDLEKKRSGHHTPSGA